MDDRVTENFPVDWDEDHFVTRREFFKYTTLASGGLALGTVALAVSVRIPKGVRHFDTAKICLSGDLKPGSAFGFSYPRPSDLCLLVRRKDGSLVAFSRRCTHLSCPVEYDPRPEGDRLFCPCHNGAFSLEDGRVLQGPPPRALPLVLVEEKAGEIWALGVKMEKPS